MARLSIFFFLSLFFFVSITNAASDQSEEAGVYIVYMGGKGSSTPGTLRADQARLMNSLSERNAMVQVFKHGFTGFSAHMSKEEANLITREPGVVSVFPDKELKLRTTRSWSFLKLQHYLDNPIPATELHSSTANGADTIIGLIDTGVWPESKSFNDQGMGPIPKHWKGTCQETEDFPASSCNRKIIGARHFDTRNQTSRDVDGHGSHTSSTAAGASVPGVSYYGLAPGTAIGGSPTSRIAVYKACYGYGCASSAILAAMDTAIHDGVDIMSLSLGSEPGYTFNIWTDPIAVGAFHAVEHGIMVVCAAGNGGPLPSSVVNFAPWITTVGASTIDRHVYANVVLGTNQVIKGGGIQFSGLSDSPKYPLIDGVSAKVQAHNISDDLARDCLPGSLDISKVKGRIVLCFNEISSEADKIRGIITQGARGLIMVDDDAKIQSDLVLVGDLTFPLTSIGSKDGNATLKYIQSNRNPTATIRRSATSLGYKPAPIVALFSSRGPSYLSHNLLKPDITAPGVNIIAAWSKMNTEFALPGQAPPDYVVISGTSMATPHIAGVAALIKSQHPTWDPSAIRSAIMTTAIQTCRDGSPVLRLPGLQEATPYDFGAGEVNMEQVMNPGLVYETAMTDHYLFLCNLGYNMSTIKLIAKNIPEGFSCPKNANTELISNLNYPSIAIAKFKKNVDRKVTRTVTNVGDEEETVYEVTVDAPEHIKVQVKPHKLHFTKEFQKRSFDVNFSTKYSLKSDVFGWITWSNDKYRVRSPFALSKNDRSSN
ncbi:CO(2)-response secreted protease [Heracleum sosnowskyi]|uniref:CO(2)-response secreted protease n=1 Tax=Heracleum sosnowskyi TaxID=360622 RepID=A0AAD8H1E4_9APIA|nr:CO(2)-response secreted protease [Heracleum sosnowskyi]